jgi:uncharacterized OB-fold protein
MQNDIPLPMPTPDSKPYWEGLREGRLLIQKCGRCGKLRHYPRPVCDACFAMEVEWIEASGRGTVHSWTQTHHAFLPKFAADLPYVLVTVDLEEGVRMIARLRHGSDTIEIGALVDCAFENYNDDWTFPIFVPSVDVAAK